MRSLFALMLIVIASPLYGQIDIQPNTAEELREFETQFRQVVREVAPTVVQWRGTDKVQLGGSGVVFDKSGLILTHSHHGYKVGQTVTVHFSDGRVLPATLLSVFNARQAEWSVIKLSRPGKYHIAPLLLDAMPEAGQWCFHVGYPGAHYPTAEQAEGAHPLQLVRLGRIVTIDHCAIRASCLTNPGDSGGPLFDLQGRVIGIHRSGSKAVNWPGGWTAVPVVFNVNELFASLVLQDAFDGNAVKPIDEGDVRWRGISPAAFEQLVEPARRATVQLLIDGRPAALGVVVAADGIILTKRAEILTVGGNLVGELSCRLANGVELPGRVIADSHGDDVALVQVNRRELPIAPWSGSNRVEQGSLIVTVGLEEQPLSLGVIATDNGFAVGGVPGFIGLSGHPEKAALDRGVSLSRLCLHPDDRGLRVQEHIGGRTGFCLAWDKLRDGDLITHVEGQPLGDFDEWLKQTNGKSWFAGDLVQLTINRDGVMRQFVFPLAPGVTIPEGHLTPFQREGSLSPRMHGFASVIAHDAVLAREQCGGPVVDLNGCVVGVNIARYGREKTLAIPHDIARELVNKLVAKKR